MAGIKRIMSKNYSSFSDLLKLNYNRDTGVFIWLVCRTFTAKHGSIAGGKTQAGYVRIKLGGKEYLAHRLAWFIMNGPIPDGYEIDHINGIRDDNRICNLRLANPQQQRANAKINSDNSSGYRGVYWNKRRKKWRAYIRRQHLGYFDTKEAAAASYARAFNKEFGRQYRRAA